MPNVITITCQCRYTIKDLKSVMKHLSKQLDDINIYSLFFKYIQKNMNLFIVFKTFGFFKSIF